MGWNLNSFLIWEHLLKCGGHCNTAGLWGPGGDLQEQTVPCDTLPLIYCFWGLFFPQHPPAAANSCTALSRVKYHLSSRWPLSACPPPCIKSCSAILSRFFWETFLFLSQFTSSLPTLGQGLISCDDIAIKQRKFSNLFVLFCAQAGGEHQLCCTHWLPWSQIGFCHWEVCLLSPFWGVHRFAVSRWGFSLLVK